MTCPLVDLRSSGTHALPQGTISFICVQFWGKFGQIIGWHLQIVDWRPRLRNPEFATAIFL